MKKILVIEDQAQTQNFFLRGLAAKGFYTITAENGRVGVQRAQEQLPDLIISGIVVPELDGYGVLTTLRQNAVTAIIPFIFVTAKVTRNDLRKGMELGANDYLTQPCTLEELLRAIAVQLERQTLLQQWYARKPYSFSELPSQQMATSGSMARNAPTQYDQLVSEPPPAEKATFTVDPEFIFPSEPPLSEVFRFIEANYHQPIALGDVAQAVGYSPAYLTSLTRRQTGQTVQRWIIQRRMIAARSLLLETDQIVEQIAEQIGYRNTNHFFRQFRQLHGTTPQSWRSVNRN